MEFSYRLNEADYLLARKIVVKRPKRPWARALSYTYLGVLFVVTWWALLAGMLLEWSDVSGEKFSHAPVGYLVISSIIPSLIYYGLVLLSVRFVIWWPRVMSGREHFRTDTGCQSETTAIITSESAGFRSARGSSESVWDCFSAWGERKGIVVLVTRAGVRKILKISGLSAAEQDNLRTILHATLPWK